MSYDSYDEIMAALELRTRTVTGMPFVAFENAIYKPTTNVPYVRSRFIPTDRRQTSFGVGTDGKPYFQHYYGVYQLQLHMPESKGRQDTNRLVSAIIDKFETATDLENNGVYVTIRQVERMRGRNEAPWFITPVNVHWYSYAK